jgi:inorganic pyrophosphatase
VRELDGVRSELRDEIAHFFDVYKDLEPGKNVVVEGWKGREDAEKLVAEARAAYALRPSGTPSGS